MLCQFSFKNYKSFHNEATLDMQATAISEHEDSLLVHTDNQKFLPLAVIYGPNGGGKSTVLDAFAFLVSKVMRPIYFLKNEKEIKSKSFTCAIPFKFDEKSVKAPTEFKLFFRTKHAEYRYTLKIQKDVIVYESLFKQNINGRKAIKLFVRDKSIGKIDVGQSLKSLGELDVSETMPFLSYVKILKDIDVINEAIEWFSSCELINFNIPYADMRVILFNNEKIKKFL